MKTTHFKRKLALKKVTVAHLDNFELKGINGGAVSLEACSEVTDCENDCDTKSPTLPGGPGCERLHALIKSP